MAIQCPGRNKKNCWAKVNLNKTLPSLYNGPPTCEMCSKTIDVATGFMHGACDCKYDLCLQCAIKKFNCDHSDGHSCTDCMLKYSSKIEESICKKCWGYFFILCILVHVITFGIVFLYK